jgi:hypothetical protein
MIKLFAYQSLLNKFRATDLGSGEVGTLPEYKSKGRDFDPLFLKFK